MSLTAPYNAEIRSVYQEDFVHLLAASSTYTTLGM